MMSKNLYMFTTSFPTFDQRWGIGLLPARSLILATDCRAYTGRGRHELRRLVLPQGQWKRVIKEEFLAMLCWIAILGGLLTMLKLRYARSHYNSCHENSQIICCRTVSDGLRRVIGQRRQGYGRTEGRPRQKRR